MSANTAEIMLARRTKEMEARISELEAENRALREELQKNDDRNVSLTFHAQEYAERLHEARPAIIRQILLDSQVINKGLAAAVPVKCLFDTKEIRGITK